jgi:hypothetical protein
MMLIGPLGGGRRGRRTRSSIHSTSPPTLTGRVRVLFSAEVVSADVGRLTAEQQDDGRWVVDFLELAPSGSLDWRGHATVRAIDTLHRNAAKARWLLSRGAAGRPLDERCYCSPCG